MGLQTLPRARSLSSFEPATRTDTTPEGAPRILVVDDHAAHRDILRRYLVHWGARPTVAPDAATALTRLREATAAGRPYQLAILDLTMPDMDGFALAHHLLQDRDLRGTPLVLLTAYDQQGQAQAALRRGFRAYLTKPVRHSRLLETVQAILQEPQA